MSCDEVQRSLSALFDEELDDAAREQVLEHLAGCETCAAELEALEALTDVVRDSVPMPDAAAWGRFDDGLRSSLQGARPVGVAGPRLQRWVMAGLALAASLAIAVYLARRVTEPTVVLADQPYYLPALKHEDPAFVLPVATDVPPLESVAGIDAVMAVLGQDAIGALREDGLVQVKDPTTLAELYPAQAAPLGAPAPLATADASLLLYGSVAARGALVLEREVLIPGVQELLGLLARELRGFEGAAVSDDVRAAARLARERVGVAAVLDGVDPLLPADALARVKEEVERVHGASEVKESPVAGRVLDYGDFKPRGIYVVDDRLKAHARAVRWLAQVGFAVIGESRRETRAACLLVMALARGKLSDGAYGLHGYGRLEAAVEILFGEPDELTVFDVLRSLQQGVRTPAPRLSALASPQVLEAVVEQAEREAVARGVNRIRAAGPARPADLFLLGNTRSVEARVYTRLTRPALAKRDEPTSLDLLFLLGARRRARTIVSAQNQDVRGYDDALQALEDEAIAWRDPTRPVPYRSSLERGRLLALSALIDGKTPNGPLPFMGSPVYRDRLLLCALAGLNSPPAGSSAAPEEIESGPVPLVEPLPRLHARLATGARRLAAVLELLGGQAQGIPEVVRDLRRVEQLERALSDASLDVLAGRAPGAETSRVLASYSGTIRALGPKGVRSSEDVFELRRLNGVTSILHRVVPRLDRLYVVTLDPVTKAPRLACGAALTASEVWVDDRRLSPSDLEGRDDVKDPNWAKHLKGEVR